MQVTTLDKFFDSYPEDGHYAVWKSGQDTTNGLYGFSGVVVEYNNMEGFKNYPDWMDSDNDYEIKVMLLERLPSVAELMGYDDDF
jgi:hypothetical protein